MKIRRLAWLFLLITIGMVFAACKSGQANQTLDETAIVQERLPTLQAQMTSFAGQLTQNAPTMQAIMTMVATSGPPSGQLPTATPSTVTPTVQGGATAAPNPFNDVNQTTKTDMITVGQTVNGTFNSATEAHNWTFQATAGQTITITVNSPGDPRIKVIDPAGNIIADVDGSASSIVETTTITFSTAGAYILRIDTWNGGTYTLTVQ